MAIKLSLGISPCPNDTFIFDAMIHGKIDTEGLSFDVSMGDVEELNKKAFQGVSDITKISFHAYAFLTEDYVLLDSGSALGNKCGPLLISKREYSPEEVPDLKIAIPGKYTTANFLLSFAAPRAKNKTGVLFSRIEEKVLQGEYDAGVIIHENRFTYREKGLRKIIDLGEYWETLTGCPIPLGGIVAKRDLPAETLKKVNSVLKKSVEYALENPEASAVFVKKHAQEMDTEVIRNHISLYVNSFTVGLGEKGREAIRKMFYSGLEKGIIQKYNDDLFVF